MEKNGKSEAALRRCAKAALLLHSFYSSNSQLQEKWEREIHDLKIQLVKERFMKRKIMLCSLAELFLQLLLCLSIWTFLFFYFL